MKRLCPDLTFSNYNSSCAAHVVRPDLKRQTVRPVAVTQTLTASTSQQFNQLSEMLGCTLGFQPLQKFPIARYMNNRSLNPARNQDGDEIAVLNANFGSYKMMLMWAIGLEIMLNLEQNQKSTQRSETETSFNGLSICGQGL